MNYKYKEMAREHWQEWLPKMYQEMEASGRLEHHLEEAARLTQQQMKSLMDSGLYEHEAWEMVREEYILRKPEPEAYEDQEEDEDDKARRELYELDREIFRKMLNDLAEP
jgi:hypothetical protein